MQNDQLISLVNRIREHQCEMQQIEVKAAVVNCPTRLFDTLSSFSNQDGGGIIVFGISESRDFEVVGVYDAQDLQKKVTEQCKQMQPIVRPLFTVATIEGKTVVSCELPGVDMSGRPVFYKGVGRIKGSYIRVGEADEPMSEYEVYSYEAWRKKQSDELLRLPKNDFTEVNQNQVDQFLIKLRTKKPNIASLPNEKILALSGITSENELTLAGLMLFGLYPQAFSPQLCITAVVVPGKKIGDTGDEGERFIDNKRYDGTIPQMAEDALAFTLRNMREKTIIDENGKRADKPEYPIKALREIILNALIHRDYSFHTQNSPIRIMMFKDRIEVENPGGLYGRITLNNLGEIGADTRNPHIAANLEVMIDTENRFSGIPTIRNEMQKAGLAPPVFENNRGIFKVTLYNASAKTASDNVTLPMSEKILEFCKTPRTREEIIAFTGFSRYYAMSKLVLPLIKSGELKMTMPDKPKSRNQSYVQVLK